MTQVFGTTAVNGLIRLPADVPPSAHCLVTVLAESRDQLVADAEFEIPSVQQARMAELLLRNREGNLSPRESQELDQLAAEFDIATIARGRAMAMLAQIDRPSDSD
jgi:hypothetical protein